MAAKGKQTMIRMNDNRRDIGALSTVKVLGREELTNAEKAHDELLFLLLTCQKDLRTSPFIRDLWFPTWKDMHEPPDVVDEHYADSVISKMGLNDSQRVVVQAMVGEQPIVVTHGIPHLLCTSTTELASL
jgi:regulator of nonsense transcripts 1